MQHFLGAFLLSLTLLACGSAEDSVMVDDHPNLAGIPLIPLPARIEDSGSFHIVAEGTTAAEIATVEPAPTAPRESYRLVVLPDKITISGDSLGRLHGAQTLEQLLFFAGRRDGRIYLPTGTITDRPRFAYRGHMLDVARHFFGVDSVKTVIDNIARYKINHLHLHLTDDQGWRIEIKSWPRLTEIGGLTEVDGTPGGFYTQEDYREIVRYAGTKGITIVPEVDMPGHTNAAIVAYPELNGTDTEARPHFGTEVGFSTLRVRSAETARFVEDVVREIAALTPGPYFHLGGDESDVTDHEDYVYFVNFAQEVISRNGKISVGWDEIATATPERGTVTHYWRHEENVTTTVKLGNQVLMSPADRTYLDMQYDSTSRIGLHWAAYISPRKAYDWNPAARIPGLTDDHILGIEAPLWTETVRTPEDIDYLTYPRLPAIAEVGWTPQDRRDWEVFRVRLAAHYAWWQTLGIGAYGAAEGLE